ncbi:MAG: hypothetical protein ACI4FN_07735 [Acutalibacteraceae bacterium]
MQRTPGLYVTLQRDSKIKRTLVTDKGETVLDDTTIGAELIRYAELDYSTYKPEKQHHIVIGLFAKARPAKK